VFRGFSLRPISTGIPNSIKSITSVTRARRRKNSLCRVASTVRNRVASLAVVLTFSMLCLLLHVERSAAQDPVLPDVVQSITALVQKLGTLKDDRAKLDAALKRLDTDVASLRDKDDAAKSNAADLTKWLADLGDAKKDAVRKDAVFTGLFAAIDRIQDSNDFARATRLVTQLTDVLQNARLNPDEEDKFSKQLVDLSTEMEKRIKDRTLKIHIISATYGVIGTRRTCDAKAYFRAKCESQSRCPVPAANATDAPPLTISGSELCSYEPAPLAPPSANKARVEYKCIHFGLRPWAEIERNETNGTRLDFVGKGQITCDVR
jgi:cell division protein FtsB